MKSTTISKLITLFLLVSFSESAFSQPNYVSKNPSYLPSFADTVEELLPTVVNISTSLDVSSDLEDINNNKSYLDQRMNRNDVDVARKITSIGSGFLISSDGYIVSNSHVIEDSNDININLYDGSKYKAKIIGIDKKTDLALLKINTNKELKFAKFGDSNKARIGDWAIVIGNPYGLGGSVSIGIISARGRDINAGQLDEYIQTDAAINKGNSGGPLFNSKGEVIGISSAIYSPSGGSVGIGFATPSINAIQVINQLKDMGEVSRGWIGISVQDLTEDLADSIRLEKIRGAFVSDIVPNGPADKAGILPTDVIIRFDDQEIEDMKSLPKIVNKTPINKMVNVLVWRHGKIKSLNLIVEKALDDDSRYDYRKESKIPEKKSLPKNFQAFGISLSEHKSGNIEGLIVNDVLPKTEAYDKGIMSGDIIISINQNNVNSIESFKEIIKTASVKNKKIFLFLKRNNNNFAVVLNIK
jgi:serine protease Do